MKEPLLRAMRWQGPILIVTIVILTGCAVCRHRVLSDYGWAVEEGYKPEIVLYTTTPATQAAALWIWNGHTQVSVGDKWVSYGSLWDEPEYPLGTYCWRMNLDQYIEWLSDYKWLSKEPYIERPEWPRCKKADDR